jgi:acyl-CoA dehydrogenase
MAERAESLEKRIRVEGVKTGRIHSLDLPGQISEAQEIGIINVDEAVWLRAYDRKVMDLINVDDFAPDELGTQSQPRMQVSLSIDEHDVVS